MNSLYNSKKLKIIVLILFFLIRIPILFFQSYWYLEESLVNGLENGYFLYCDFDKIHSFWETHVFPPGTYVYIIIRVVFFKNTILLISDLVNLILLYKIIKNYNGEKPAIISMMFYTFLPLSIINNGLTNDPMTISLSFILMGFYFFMNKKMILSSISLAIGTLIIYIPAIIIIPISFYFLKNKKLLDFFFYFATFVLTILLGILPFLLICPDKFIYYINLSLNSPGSANFLENDSFILSQLLNTSVFDIFGFSIKILNFYQISVLLICFYYLYTKFEFIDERDIILTSVILITLVTILSFYTHSRFYFWIFSLSFIFLSFNSEETFERDFRISSFISLGILLFFLSLFSILYFNLFINDYLIGIWVLARMVFFLYFICFALFGLLVLKERYSRINILYFIILNFISMIYLLSSNIIDVFLLNISIFIVIVISHGLLILFLKKPLLFAYRRKKLKEIVTSA